jgi:hypothetical protein
LYSTRLAAGFVCLRACSNGPRGDSTNIAGFVAAPCSIHGPLHCTARHTKRTLPSNAAGQLDLKCPKWTQHRGWPILGPCIHSIKLKIGHLIFLHSNKNLRVRPSLLQDFYASVHAAMARAVQHEHSWVRRGSVRHSSCARAPLANAPPPGAHTPGKCSSREWGLAIRSSSAFRMNASPGGVRTCRLLRLRCSNIAPMPQLGAPGQPWR